MIGTFCSTHMQHISKMRDVVQPLSTLQQMVHIVTTGLENVQRALKNSPYSSHHVYCALPVPTVIEISQPIVVRDLTSQTLTNTNTGGSSLYCNDKQSTGGIYYDADCRLSQSGIVL